MYRKSELRTIHLCTRNKSQITDSLCALHLTVYLFFVLVQIVVYWIRGSNASLAGTQEKQAVVVLNFYSVFFLFFVLKPRENTQTT